MKMPDMKMQDMKMTDQKWRQGQSLFCSTTRTSWWKPVL